jgi:hypothetical protein
MRKEAIDLFLGMFFCGIIIVLATAFAWTKKTSDA